MDASGRVYVAKSVNLNENDFSFATSLSLLAHNDQTTNMPKPTGVCLEFRNFYSTFDFSDIIEFCTNKSCLDTTLDMVNTLPHYHNVTSDAISSNTSCSTNEHVEEYALETQVHKNIIMLKKNLIL